MGQGEGGGRLKLPSHLRPVSDLRMADTLAEVTPRKQPPKPEVIAENETLSALWDEVVPLLDNAGLLSEVDGMAIVHMIQAHVVSDRAFWELMSSDSVVTNDHHVAGGKKKHPAEAIMRSQSDMFLRYAQQLGMTFVSRARTPVTKAGDASGDENPFTAKALG